MALRPSSIADFTNAWQQFVTAMEANASDLQHLEPLRLDLVDVLSQVQTISTEEKARRSERQQSTQKRKEVLARGKDIASRLQAGVKAVYGPKSEKLVEFGTLPFRKRVRRNDPLSKAPVPGDKQQQS